MAAGTTLSLSFPEADIAVLTLDDPQSSANILSRHVLDELERHLDDLDRRQQLAGLVIRSAKPGMFIAGADLKEFSQWLDAPKDEIASYCRRGQKLFGRLASANYVTVAAIDGMCVGGGAELAIWCDRRILTANERTAYGFPEVKLGLFPGWGGTARALRMIGLSNAVELVTGGDPIDARAAAAMGLANDVVTLSPAATGSGTAKPVAPGSAGASPGPAQNSDPLLTAAIRIRAESKTSQQFRRDRKRCPHRSK